MARDGLLVSATGDTMQRTNASITRGSNIFPSVYQLTFLNLFGGAQDSDNEDYVPLIVGCLVGFVALVLAIVLVVVHRKPRAVNSKMLPS